MSDLEKFKELYDKLGVTYHLIQLVERAKHGMYQDTYEIPAMGYELILQEGSCKKVVGYNEFYTTIYFDPEGKFICQGIWE